MSQYTEVEIKLEKESLHGNLFVPSEATGLVLFAHGSGSSRFSKRNQQVARYLNEQGLATLLFDLLTPNEEMIDIQTTQFRFNIPLLAERLAWTTDWALDQLTLKGLNIGFFGSSTGAAAALIAAAKRPEVVKAVVSRGGRPDLAYDFLPDVLAPTLFIVGGLDTEVIRLNQLAASKMQAASIKDLVIVEGATHLFEEPGKLDEVMTLAGKWFTRFC